jgi:thiol:disulfide interchange protein
MVSRETKVTAVFVVLGTALWLVTTTLTDARWVQWAVLVGVGIVAPTLVNEWSLRTS